MQRHCDRGALSELVTAVGGDLIEGRDSIEGVPEAAHIGSIGAHVTGSEAVPAIILPGEDLGEEEGDVHPGAEEPDGRVALQEDDLDPGLAGLPLAYLPLFILVPDNERVDLREPQQPPVPGGEALVGVRILERLRENLRIVQALPLRQGYPL